MAPTHSPRVVVTLVRHARLVVSCSLHLCIFAMGQKVPFSMLYRDGYQAEKIGRSSLTRVSRRVLRGPPAPRRCRPGAQGPRRGRGRVRAGTSSRPSRCRGGGSTRRRGSPLSGGPQDPAVTATETELDGPLIPSAVTVMVLVPGWSGPRRCSRASARWSPTSSHPHPAPTPARRCRCPLDRSSSGRPGPARSSAAVPDSAAVAPLRAG